MPSPSLRRPCPLPSPRPTVQLLATAAALVLVATLLALVPSAPATGAVSELVAGRGPSILFSSGSSYRRDLGSLDLSTGERTYYGSPKFGRYDELRAPTVSPDQNKVAMQLDPGNDPQLVVLDLRTNSLTTLAARGAFPPEWTPDGSAVLAAWDVQQPDGQYSRDVWLFPVPPEGAQPGAPVRLPGTRDLAHASTNPAGDTLVASHTQTGELVRQRLDGTERVVIGRGHAPRWSPDGAQIVYSVYDPAGNGSWSLRVTDPDGQGDRLLVGAEQLASLGVSGSTGRPSWTADGAHVLFDVTPFAAPSGNGDLFRIGRDGSGLTRLTDTPEADERHPAQHLGLPAAPTPSPDAVPSSPAATSPSPSVPPSPSPTAATPPAPPRVTLGATSIAAGQRVSVTYRGVPGTVVDVLSRTQPATAFSRIATVTLGADGTAQTSHAPQRNTRMAARAVGGPLSSDQPLISVRSVASLNVARTGTRTYAFSGRVYPARDQRLVSLYRDGRLLVQGRTGADGIYRLTRTLPAGAATYEIRTSDDTWNLGARSAPRRFTAV